jgi:2-polyprenyl-6-methoxyphenol hydroxylase-like FAD-dependent oxidoreductase
LIEIARDHAVPPTYRGHSEDHEHDGHGGAGCAHHRGWPTGLALAGQLQAMGARVRIVDRQADRVHESRALAIQPRTLEILRGLGVTEQLVDRGKPATRIELRAGGRRIEIPVFDIGAEDTAYPFLLFLSQAETEGILVEHLAAQGVALERRVELVGFDQSAGYVRSILRGEDGSTEEVLSRYLVGCDGARSTVRHHARIPFVGDAYPQTFALGDVEADGDLDPDIAHAYLGPQGVLFFFPLGAPTTWRVIGRVPDAAGKRQREDGSGNLSLSNLQQLVDAFTGSSVTLRDPAWLTTFGLQHRQAARYRAGWVFLAGDSAHVHSPAGVQGMNTGIQDAWNLGWKLALVSSGVADPALLETYHAERWPVGRFVLRFSDRALTAGVSTNLVARSLRTQVAPVLLPLFTRFAKARALAFRTVSELSLNYRRSPAVQEDTPTLSGGPKAGDRLPDSRIERNGVPGSLQEALAAPAFHLLLCGPVGVWNEQRLAAFRQRHGRVMQVHRLSREAEPEAMHDPYGEGFTRLGVRSTGQYLVRPDGYVGFRSGGSDLQNLQRYLARWLPGTGPR